MKTERFIYNPFLYITMDKKIDDDTEKKLKLQFTTSDDIWDKVLKYKINTGLKNNKNVQRVKFSAKPERDIQIHSIPID